VKEAGFSFARGGTLDLETLAAKKRSKISVFSEHLDQTLRIDSLKDIRRRDEVR